MFYRNVLEEHGSLQKVPPDRGCNHARGHQRSAVLFHSFVQVTNLTQRALEGVTMRAATSAALSPTPASQAVRALPPLPPLGTSAHSLDFTLDTFGQAAVHLQVLRAIGREGNGRETDARFGPPIGREGNRRQTDARFGPPIGREGNWRQTDARFGPPI
eukprot:1188319-Prorocentrum_minimum.AAC.1